MKPYSHPVQTDAAGFRILGKSEGEMREQLAAYFLTAPHPDRQTEKQQAHHKAVLRCLLDMETQSILQFAGLARPLVKGDLAALLRNTLEACVSLCKKRPLFTFRCSNGFPSRRTAAFEPRLVQMAAVGLVRASCLANPEGSVAATLYARPDTLILAVTGERPARDSGALDVAKETARLHEGSLAVCAETIGLSLRTTLAGEGGRYIAPTVSELLQDTLSCVQIGFYSSLG